MKAVERDDFVADVADEVERRLMRTLALNDRLTELEAQVGKLGGQLLPKPPPVRHLHLMPGEPDA